jgi:CheY-like chemotaxis protein
MNSVGRILVLDDEESWQNILARLLRAASFQVDVAGTVDEARTILNENFYHVVVADVSMVHGDATNTEGLQLVSELKQDVHRGGMEVVLISAYANKSRLREAFKEFKVADFQDKFDFDQRAFVFEVGKILAKSVNLDLDVQWEAPNQPDQVVLNLEIDGERVKRETPLHSRTTEELGDLLCRLFPDASSLLVKPMAQATSGSAVLHVRPFYIDGAAKPVLLKVGCFRRISREYENFKKHVQPFIGRRSTSVIGLRQTTHLGGILYSLLGSVGDKIETFARFYAHNNLSQIQETLTRLFRETCGAWYANPGHLNLYNLSDGYRGMLGFSNESLVKALSQLKGVQGKRQIYFDSLGERPFTNPIVACAPCQFMKSTYVCNTHGDLNGDNILVDGSDHAWLIDFESTGPGHILRDIAELDLVVRVQLLLAQECSLGERLQMEEALGQARQFGDVENLLGAFQTENRALAKAYATTIHLRRIASNMVSKNPSADLDEYYIALLYYSMNALRFLSWSSIQRQHAFLSASLISDHLGL